MAKLEERILDGLDAIGYNGPMLKKPDFPIAIERGPKSIEYTQLVNFLTNEIRNLLGIDEEVNAITSPEDSVAFVMEITSFLKEMNCPYKTLMQGYVSERLETASDRLLLIDYLLSELMAARILQEKKPEKKIVLKIHETDESKDMRLILQTLRFPKPPPNISIVTLFNKLVPTIPIVFNKAGRDIVGNGIFNALLSGKQWDSLKNVNQDLNNEYKTRREMLLTRLDVTIQSFQWSDRTRGKDDLFEKAYHDKRKSLKVEPDVDLADLLAAREDLAVIEKTSSSSVRKNTSSHLNKVIIGAVPDRGGRTSEIAPPPPEMPAWQKRTASPPRGGSSQRGGNYSRGGGNYSRGGNRGNYSRGGGGGGNYSQQNEAPSYSGYQQNRGDNTNFDSAGSYERKYDTGNYGRGGYDNYNRGGGRGGYNNRGNHQNQTQNYNTGGNYGNNYDDNSGPGGYNSGPGGYDSGRMDSGGSYTSYDPHQTKRAKTYDSFQAAKMTYTDQYVQENQHNQQYASRGGGGRGGRRGGGRSNYQRGRGRY